MARWVISTVREAHGHAGVVESSSSVGPAFARQTFSWRTDPEKLPLAAAAFAACEAEFPQGRYARDLRFWRAVHALDHADWATGLPVIVSVLDDPAQGDLHMDAALNFAAACMLLLEKPEHRPALIAVLRENAALQGRLWQFMHTGTSGSRLLPLEGYLREAGALPSAASQ